MTRILGWTLKCWLAQACVNWRAKCYFGMRLWKSLLWVDQNQLKFPRNPGFCLTTRKKNSSTVQVEQSLDWILYESIVMTFGGGRGYPLNLTTFLLRCGSCISRTVVSLLWRLGCLHCMCIPGSQKGMCGLTQLCKLLRYVLGRNAPRLPLLNPVESTLFPCW